MVNLDYKIGCCLSLAWVGCCPSELSNSESMTQTSSAVIIEQEFVMFSCDSSSSLLIPSPLGYVLCLNATDSEA